MASCQFYGAEFHSNSSKYNVKFELLLCDLSPQVRRLNLEMNQSNCSFQPITVEWFNQRVHSLTLMRSGPHGAGVYAESRVIYDTVTSNNESFLRFLILVTEGNSAEFNWGLERWIAISC